MPFTPEELAEMAAADAEIEATFRLEQADLDRSRDLDRQAHFDGLDPEKQRVAAQQKAWYEANKDKVAAQQKAWYEANKDKYNAYMREYMRKRRTKEHGSKRREVRPAVTGPDGGSRVAHGCR